MNKSASLVSDVQLTELRGAQKLFRGEAQTIILLEGELDRSTRDDLRKSLFRELINTDANLVLDVSGVTFIDASIVDTLVTAANYLRERNRTLALWAPSRCVQRIVDICGLGATFSASLETFVSIPPQSANRLTA